MIQSKEWERLPANIKQTIMKYHSQHPVELGNLAKELDLIVKLATLPANISGEIKECDGVVSIRVNKHDVKARRRYTLAHEIAHFLLHRHLLNDGITDDVLYRSTQSNEIEAEANRLAADIIMPIIKINECYALHFKGKKDAALYEAIANELGVSTTALKYRLGINT